MPLSLGTSVGRMVCVHLMNVISNIFHVITVFTRILAAATINFSCARVRLLIEGGSYSRAALIKNNAHARLTYTRANAIYNKPDQNFMLARVQNITSVRSYNDRQCQVHFHIGHTCVV